MRSWETMPRRYSANRTPYKNYTGRHAAKQHCESVVNSLSAAKNGIKAREALSESLNQ